MRGFETIRYEHADLVGRLTLSRPDKRNAQNPAMWREIQELGRALLLDEDLRCLVIAGDGPCFSAGIDLVEGLSEQITAWATRPTDSVALEEGVAAAETFRWVGQLRCPSLAVVHGHAYGAGLQLALACDLRMFARTTSVGLIETRFGIMPDMGATIRLPRIVGDGWARELILLGKVIDSAEAYRIGLANWVVEDIDLELAASDMANQLASQPPIALQGARRALDQAWHPDLDHAYRVAIEGQIRCLGSDDFATAIRALAEGTTPEWSGR